MATRKLKYKTKSRRVTGKRSANIRTLDLYAYINKKKKNIFKDYINILKSLDTKQQMARIASSIEPKSPQWNQIRRKRVTSSNIKRICKWKNESPYIFRKVTKYVSNKYESRGDKVEKAVLNVIEDSGFNLAHKGQIWVHRDLIWLSCTTDSIIMSNNQIKIAVEIKSYESTASLKKAFKIIENNFILKKTSAEYYQVQAIIEVLNITHCLLVVEHKLTLHSHLVQRDFDFLHNNFHKIRDFYFKYQLPYLLYGPLSNNSKTLKPRIEYFRKRTYVELMNMLHKHEDLVIGNTDMSYLEYYTNEKPSQVNDGFMEKFTDANLINRLKGDWLKYKHISI